MQGSPLLVDAENSVLLPTVMRHFFLVLQVRPRHWGWLNTPPLLL
jgi:hypothetical protein